MNDTLQELKDRGFIAQCTDIVGLSNLMDSQPITFYVGVDPTGASLHVGHIVPFFALRHLVQHGHKAIILLGGGTARIGDPSGKTSMRKMLDYDTIDSNANNIKMQLASTAIIGDIKDKNALQYSNNKDWLATLNYIDFLREIGSCFSVNKMLSYEAYKQRMEKGLSFIEFNYQLLQSYDFLQLHSRFACNLQIGGDDQWGNITAGVDLIRRKCGANDSCNVFGLTFPLVTTSDGKKMGKTEKGALFLDSKLTSVYDFYQYWRNIDDKDVKKFMLLFTFIDIKEINDICNGDINLAKERLAYEITSIIHGKQSADKALSGAKAAFSGNGDLDSIPQITLNKTILQEGISIVDLFYTCKLCSSKSEARRLVKQGGASIDSCIIKDVKALITNKNINDKNYLILRAGKKKFIRVILN